MAHKLGLLCAAAALGLGIHVSRSHAFNHQQATQRYQDRYYLPPPHWLVIGSLGYREALADMVWISALNNFGEELSHRGEAQYVYHYADAALALDPNFRRVYLWIANVALYRPIKLTAEEGFRAGRYLEEAARRFPNDGEVLWQLGAHYAYELAPLVDDPEQRKELKRKAVPYFQAASLLGAGPPWLALSTANSLEGLGQKETAIAHLTELYMTVDDPTTKASIAQRLAELKNQAFAEALGRTEVIWRQQKQAELPYLSDTLYLLIGPRPPFDAAGQLARYFDPLPATRLSDGEEDSRDGP